MPMTSDGLLRITGGHTYAADERGLQTANSPHCDFRFSTGGSLSLCLNHLTPTCTWPPCPSCPRCSPIPPPTPRQLCRDLREGISTNARNTPPAWYPHRWPATTTCVAGFEPTASCRPHRHSPHHAYLRALTGDHALRVGPFVLLLAATDAGPYRNDVIPDDGAAPRPADIDALIAAFADRERKLRLEKPWPPHAFRLNRPCSTPAS